MKAKQYRIILAVDPGTGSSSPTGIAVMDPDDWELITSVNIQPSKGLSKLEHRIKFICYKLAQMCEHLGGESRSDVLVCIESFVMRGKGGETLQRLIGAVMATVPYTWDILHVQNTSIKAVVGGHGRADKLGVAKGLIDFFAITNKASARVIQEAIQAEDWDRIDAVGIGVTGWLKQQSQNQSQKNSSPKKRRKKR